MNREGIKAFWDENKFDIMKVTILSIIGYAVGVKVGKCMYTKDERELINEVREFGDSRTGLSMAKNLCESLSSCHKVRVYKPTTPSETIESLVCYLSNNDDLKTRGITRAILFLDEK